MTRSLTIQGRILDNSIRRDLPASVRYGKFISPAGDLPLFREHEGQVIGSVTFWRGLDCLRFIGRLNFNVPDGQYLERDVRSGTVYQTSVSGEPLEEDTTDTGLSFPRFRVLSLSLVSRGAIEDRSVIEYTVMEDAEQRSNRFRLLSHSDAAANEKREIADLKERARWKRKTSGTRHTEPMPIMPPARGMQYRHDEPWKDGTKQTRVIHI